VREYCETWSLYGFFGLGFVAMVASALLLEPAVCGRALKPARLFLPVLAGLVATQLLASYVKTRPMGWWDWDLFTYAAYPANLLAACLLVRLQHRAEPGGGRAHFRGLRDRLVPDGLRLHEPRLPRVEWSGLPPRKRALAFESYWPMPANPGLRGRSSRCSRGQPFSLASSPSGHGERELPLASSGARAGDCGRWTACDRTRILMHPEMTELVQGTA
jgi:hypothetical protein